MRFPSVDAELVAMMYAEEVSDEAKVRMLQGFRASRQASKELDGLLVREVVKQRGTLGELKQVVAQLRERHAEYERVIAKFRAPPWHEMMFIERDASSGVPRAKIAGARGRLLVTVDDDVDVGDLDPGQPVYVSEDGNVLVRRSSGGANRLGETAAVDRRLTGDRIVVSQNDREYVVDLPVHLRDYPFRSGDEVVWSPHAMMVFEVLPAPDGGRSVVDLEEIAGSPVLVGGLDAELERMVGLFTARLSDPEGAALFGVDRGNGSVLLVGPPGCGKTTIARYVAYLMSQRAGKPCRFAAVNGAALESPWVGSTQRNITRLFQDLNTYEGPAILFIDEVESIGRHRGSAVGYHGDKFLSTWLGELDGLKQRTALGVIAATNRKDLIDQALLERVSGTELHIHRPNMEAAREIAGIHLAASVPYQPNGDAVAATRHALIETIVARLYLPNGEEPLATVKFRDGTERPVHVRELVSGRVIEQVAFAARQRAFERYAGGGECGLCRDDVEDALCDTIEKLGRSLSVRNVRHLLEGVPDDADVVGVERSRAGIRQHQYLH